VKFSLLLISFLCGVFPRHIKTYGDHPIHVSVTEVKWNATSSTFEASVKIFIDDLESSLMKEKVSGLHIGTEKEADGADDIILNYLNEHFLISMDGIRLPAQWVGKEISDDYAAIWCYVEFPGIKNPKACTISNDILFELYDDQRSIMDITMSSADKVYTIFEPGKSSWSYTF
jgi:hypothetical protein